LTPLISSLTVTVSSPLQSPVHASAGRAMPTKIATAVIPHVTVFRKFPMIRSFKS
jgi:hypothetical protein